MKKFIVLITLILVTLPSFAFFGLPEGWFEFTEVKKELSDMYKADDMWVKVAQKKTDKNVIYINGKYDTFKYNLWITDKNLLSELGRKAVTYTGWSFFIELNGKKIPLKFTKGDIKFNVRTEEGLGAFTTFESIGVITLPKSIQFYLDNSAVLYASFELEDENEEIKQALYKYEFKKEK